MDWIADPTTAGAWLQERMDQEWSMHHYVPHGFAAYARIFHPGVVRSLPDGPVPEMSEVVRMPEAEQLRLFERFVDSPARWADAAAAFGTSLHPLAQWQHVVRTPVDADWRERIAPDGRAFFSPAEGEMSLELFAAVARQLTAHTTTPDAGCVAVWEGWGGLVGAYGGPGRAFIEFTDEPPREPMWWGSLRQNFENPFRRARWHSGILSDEISRGPRLELPDRDHVLFSAAPSAFADSDWILDAPWRDREAEARGSAPAAQHPSILWPDDRAWVMVTEIDDDSTIVAGSAQLIDALCADPAIEALPIPEGSSLYDDEVNRL